ARSELGAAGFSASWRISRLALSGADAKEQGAVSFVEPAGLYQRLERASEYGFLFIGLTVAAFILFALLRPLPLPPLPHPPRHPPGAVSTGVPRALHALPPSPPALRAHRLRGRVRGRHRGLRGADHRLPRACPEERAARARLRRGARLALRAALFAAARRGP